MVEENGNTDVALADSAGAFTENWAEKLGDDFTDDVATLSHYDSVQKLAKFGMDSKRKLGHDPATLVKIPDESAGEEVFAEQQTAFNKAGGRPDTADEYKYELSSELKVKLGDLEDDRMAKIRKFAHEDLGISQAKFKKLLDFYHNDLSEGIDAAGVINEERQAEAIEASTAELKKEWKTGFEDRVLRANAVLRKFGGADAVASLGAENNPLMVRFLDSIASVLSESSIKGITGVTTPTSSDIETQIKKLRATDAYTNKMHPEHKAVNAEVLELYKKKKL